MLGLALGSVTWVAHDDPAGGVWWHVCSIELNREPSVFTAAKLMSTLIYRNKDNLMGA